MSSVDDKVKKSLRYSIWDGAFAGAMQGFTQEYFAPFLLLINATASQIGALTAVPNLVAAILQIRSTEVSKFLGSRKRVLNIFVLLQALMLIPMMAVAFFHGSAGSVSAFIAFVTLFTAFGAFATPAWGSMMSDLVPEENRGDFFGRRNALAGIVTIAAMFAAGLIVHYTEPFSAYFGFALVFVAAFLFRMLSWSYLKKMYEPHMPPESGRGLAFVKFISRIREDNFSRFVVSVSLMNFSVNLAGPFFAVLMLRDLKFSYLIYTLIMVAASLSVFLTTWRWGRHADHVGNIKVVKATSLLICTIPVLWLISLDPVFLVFAQIYSGFLWAGFNLSAANFIYDAVPSRSRTRGIAYFNVINGISLFAGAITGGYLVQILPPLLGYRILSLLLISTVLRLAVRFFLITGLKEVRPVGRVGNRELFFSIIGVKPLLGIERKTLRY
jgi:MFS family permease